MFDGNDTLRHPDEFPSFFILGCVKINLVVVTKVLSYVGAVGCARDQIVDVRGIPARWQQLNQTRIRGKAEIDVSKTRTVHRMFVKESNFSTKICTNG